MTADLVQIQWQIWDVELLGENDFVVNFSQEWEDWQGNVIRQEQTMYMSR